MPRNIIMEQCLINGQWCGADNGRQLAVSNPANGEPLANVPWMGADETRRAIDAADAALPAWSALPAGIRSARLRAWHDLILQNRQALADLLTREQGKPLKEAEGEIAYAASYVEWFAEEAKRAYGDVIPAPTADKRIVVLKQPVGVVAAITPWNFPSAMVTRKVAPALAAGCTIVVKPASQTPLSAMALAALAVEAGIPQGVINVVTGSAAAIGSVLTGDPRVRKLSFTGSTEVGRELLRDSAATVKKVSMELGGNAPFIVFDDADVDAAVEGAIAAKFRNNGQTCVCANRLYAQAGIYDAFVTKLTERVGQLKVGDGREAGTDLGPLIDEAAIAKVQQHIAEAVSLGASLRTGGRRSSLGGTFFEPTVLAEVTQTMQVCQEETFGPLAAVISFSTEAEVVGMANDSEFGLASYFYSRDLSRVWRVAEAIQSGMVGVNTGLISSEVAPFGGIKQSGFGREGSRYGLDDYMQTKYICLAI